MGQTLSTRVGDEKLIQNDSPKTEWKRPLGRPKSR